MSTSILSSLLSKPLVTIVNATTGAAVITGVKIKKVTPQYASFVPRHMREDGSTIVDTRIIHSTMVTLEVICPTITDVDAVIQLMNDRENLYNITSRGLVYNNMMMRAGQTKQTSEMLSSAPFTIVFDEQLLENVQPVICQQSGDSDNQDNGLQLVNNIGNNVSSLVSTVQTNFMTAANAITGFFGG